MNAAYMTYHENDARREAQSDLLTELEIGLVAAHRGWTLRRKLSNLYVSKAG